MNKSHFLLCSALLLACGMMVSCGGSQTQFEMPMAKYETKVLQPETKIYNMTFPATTCGISEIKVYPQVEGIVTKKNYTPGTIPARPMAARHIIKILLTAFILHSSLR